MTPADGALDVDKAYCAEGGDGTEIVGRCGNDGAAS